KGGLRARLRLPPRPYPAADSNEYSVVAYTRQYQGQDHLSQVQGPIQSTGLPGDQCQSGKFRSFPHAARRGADDAAEVRSFLKRREIMGGLRDWARTLLKQRRYATLATQDADGSFHLTPVWYLFQDEQLFVGAASSSRKVRNAIARPTASLVVDVRQPGAERWVAGAGPVTILR